MYICVNIDCLKLLSAMDGRDTYKFDLVLLNENNPASPLMIGCIGNVHKCHMEVYIHLHLKPGYNVDWEKTTENKSMD